MRWSGEECPPEAEDILFQEEGWYVLRLDRMLQEDPLDDLLEDLGVASAIGHDCQHFSEMHNVQLLAGDDCLAGYCWWCKEAVPESVQTVWTIHNFDYIRSINTEMVEYCIEDARATLEARKWEVHWAKGLSKS
jgi:hypothetical protein